MRWLVERTTAGNGTTFEDVGAKFMEVRDGCLIFKDHPFERATYLVAAGHWVTVVPEPEEDE